MAATPRTEWTCPMHPQIVRDAPGSCPICGMALEPRTVGAVEGPDPELVDMTRRFWIGLVLTLPLLAFVMGDMLPGQPLRHLIPGRHVGLVAAGAGDAGGPVGGLAVLRAGLGVDRQSQPQHVHADRARHWHGVRLQRRRHARAWALPAVVPHARRRGRTLLRGRGRDHGAGAAGSGTRAARAEPDEQRDPRAASPGAGDGAPAAGRRHGRGCAARARAGRRPLARAPG